MSENLSLEQLRSTDSRVTQSSGEGSAAPAKLCCLVDVSRFKKRFLSIDFHYYVKLALVEEKNERQEHLDSKKKEKQPLNDLKDIFYHKEKPSRLILITGGPGVGKTTLVNEIGLQWAKKGGLLANEFDIIIKIPLKLLQKEKSFEAVLKRYFGRDYPKVEELAGRGCLIILEGLDEMPLDRRQDDETWKSLIEENTLLEHARILITSRPHACEELVVNRKVEVMGFGDKEIRQFVKHAFPNDDDNNDDAKKFMRQLTEYPQLRSLCYVPLNLVMIIKIFQHFRKKLPSTQTELYQLFIVMILQREVETGRVKKLTVEDHDHAEATIKQNLPVSQLEMRDCHIGDTGAKLLVSHYPDKNSTGQLLEVLDLSFNDLTIAGLEDVMKIVRTSRTTLRELDVRWNKIGDDGIMMISEELQHSNSLTKLQFAECGLSVKGATAVSKLLMNSNTLQELDVCHNTIGDHGLSVIVEQLHHITTLTKLDVLECGLSVEGARVISKLLMDNYMIQILYMSFNDIGDCINAIITALTNRKVWLMEIRPRGITQEVLVRDITTLLSVNNKITMLLPKTEVGVHNILQSAVNNKACQVNISIDDACRSAVQAMIKILEDRRKINSDEVLAIREILEDRSETNVPDNIIAATNTIAKSDEAATDNDAKTENLEGGDCCKCCILM